MKLGFIATHLLRTLEQRDPKMVGFRKRKAPAVPRFRFRLRDVGSAVISLIRLEAEHIAGRRDCLDPNRGHAKLDERSPQRSD
jgi:hypothetical protein